MQWKDRWLAYPNYYRASSGTRQNNLDCKLPAKGGLAFNNCSKHIKWSQEKLHFNK